MQLSIATANLYMKPFEQVLGMIAEAGFQWIELDLFWERKHWAVAQHLKDVPIRRVVQLIEQSGLKISSIHDGGGVLEDRDSTAGFINPDLDRYLEAMSYAPECLVFHTPHIEGNPGAGWWERISDRVVHALEKYRKGYTITIENLPIFDSYFVPLTSAEALNEFVEENGLGVTLDTTHYAQMGTDILEAARKLAKNIKTIHLSDYHAGRTHVFIGDGELDLPGLFEVIDKTRLSAVTLECSLLPDNPDQEQGDHWMVNRTREGRTRLEKLLGED